MSADGRLGELEIALTYLTGALTRLTEAQAKTEERVTRLEDALIHLTERVDVLAMRMDQLVGVVGNMRGDLLELRYRQHAIAYFAPLLRGIREIPPSDLERLADEAERAGRLTEAEYEDLLRADLVLRGIDRPPAGSVALGTVVSYLVVEVSATIDSEDVERAARRAQLLQKAGWEPARGVVAGKGITEETTQVARSRNVWVVLDGRVIGKTGLLA